MILMNLAKMMILTSTILSKKLLTINLLNFNYYDPI
jgi:hypothetical protein